jgi:hypothetical protein
MTYKKTGIFLTFLAVCLSGGCAALVGRMATPTRHEMKVPAEQNLAEPKGERILVLVSQPGWLDAQANLRYYVTRAVNRQLANKLKIEPRQVVDYNEVSEFRSKRTDFAFLSPAEVGSALKADKVVLISIEDFQLVDQADTGVYNGLLSAQTAVFDVAAGARIWPSAQTARNVKVGFEAEKRGRDAAICRLADSLAYCMVRYFYDCPMDEFKMADDLNAVGWKD